MDIYDGNHLICTVNGVPFGEIDCAQLNASPCETAQNKFTNSPPEFPVMMAAQPSDCPFTTKLKLASCGPVAPLHWKATSASLPEPGKSSIIAATLLQAGPLEEASIA